MSQKYKITCFYGSADGKGCEIVLSFVPRVSDTLIFNQSTSDKICYAGEYLVIGVIIHIETNEIYLTLELVESYDY